MPFISEKLGRRIDSPNDEGLREMAEVYFKIPAGDCNFSQRDFGVIVKKPNYFLRGMSSLKPSLAISDALEPNKHYVFSEMLQALNPMAETVMMSHEGEIYELVDVIGPHSIDFIEVQDDPEMGRSVIKTRYRPGSTFLSVEPSIRKLPFGFYHRIANGSDEGLSIAHILVIAEKSMAIKDGQLMKYGINRPPNSYREN